MGFLDIFFNKEKRDLEQEIEELRTNMSSSSVADLLTSTQGSTVVNEDTIQTIPTVVSCLELITGTVAQLPIYLYREDENGNVEKITDDYRLFLLNNEANEYLSAFNFKKSITKDYLLHGGSYTYLEKKGNEITGLYPLKAKNTTLTKYIDPKGYKFSLEIDYSSEAGSFKYKPYDLLMIMKNTSDGAETTGIIEQGKKIFELSLNENEYSSNILNKGALPIGILETEGRLNKDVATRLKESWEKLYTGVRNAGKTVVLEEGLKYKPLSLSPSDLALNESKKISSEEICKLFNVPLSLILGNKGYGNLEQDNLHFTKHCLSAIITSIEAELDRSLLLEDEKMKGYYFRFDIEEMNRATEVEKYTAIEKGMKAGAVSINEARAKLDLEPLEHDYIMFSLGNVFYDKDKKEFIVPNTGQGLGEKGVEDLSEMKKGEDNAPDGVNVPGKATTKKDKVKKNEKDMEKDSK